MVGYGLPVLTPTCARLVGTTYEARKEARTARGSSYASRSSALPLSESGGTGGGGVYAVPMPGRES